MIIGLSSDSDSTQLQRSNDVFVGNERHVLVTELIDKAPFPFKGSNNVFVSNEGTSL